MYHILVEYQTGDSFSTEDTSDTLTGWTDLDIAKENLKRIQDHYSWVAIGECRGIFCNHEVCKKASEKHKQYSTQWGRFKQKEWKKTAPEFLKGLEFPEYTIRLKQDDGSEKEKMVAWTGYFETLYGAKIISDPEDGWSFSLR